MKVYIHGPNLSHQHKGQFHVHAEGCEDNGKYGQGRYWGGDSFEAPIEVESRGEIVEYIYGDFDDFDPYDSVWSSEFFFAPCTKDLINNTKRVNNA